MRNRILLALVVIAGMAPAAGQPEFVRKDPTRSRQTVRISHPEWPRDEGDFLVDTSGFQREKYANAAFDGTNYLVVWTDYRFGDSAVVYGARVSATGEVLDPVGIQLTIGGHGQFYPACAFDGTNFLVVWEDSRDGVSADIYGARVSSSGQVLDSLGIPICTAADEQWMVGVAFNGTHYLVVWEDARTDPCGDIYGARVEPSGVVLDPSGLRIGAAPGFQWFPVVASGGSDFLVAWEDGRQNSIYEIYGACVAGDGSVSASFDISNAPEDQYFPGVAFDGENYFLAWEDMRDTIDWVEAIYGARVSASGEVLDPDGILVSTGISDRITPAVTFDGTNHVVVWQEWDNPGLGISGAHVTPAGVVLDTFPIVTLNEYSETPHALAAGIGGQVLLAHHDATGTVGGKPYNTDRIWGKFLLPTGVAERTTPDAGRSTHYSGPTVVRGALEMPEGSSLELQASSCLMDITGRKVLDIPQSAFRNPQSVDVSRLAPGVYFISERWAEGGGQSGRKIVIQR